MKELILYAIFLFPLLFVAFAGFHNGVELYKERRSFHSPSGTLMFVLGMFFWFVSLFLSGVIASLYVVMKLANTMEPIGLIVAIVIMIYMFIEMKKA